MNLTSLLLAALVALETPAPAIVVDGKAFPVSVRQLMFADCADAAAKLNGKEVAVSHIAYTFGLVTDPADPSRHLIVGALDMQKSSVDIPHIAWPGMTPAEIAATDRVVDEILVHERGHLTIAVTSAAEVTALQHTVTSSVELHMRLTDIYRILNDRQLDYDTLTAHGVHQSHAPAALRGDDIRLVCK